MRHRIVRVLPDVPAIRRRFDYAVPAALDADVQLGSRVRIPLHGRRVAGWVVEDHVEPEPGVNAKDLAGSSGLGPPPAVLALADWAAWRWAGPVSSFLGTASPTRVVRAVRGRPTMAPGVSLASPGGGSVPLVDGVLDARRREDGDRSVVVRLAPALDVGMVVRELVHRWGPDGVLVVAASRLRAEQVARRLRAEGAPVAVLPDDWAAARSGRCVTVGTRSAAWAPIERLRAAVVLDAHDEAHREERAPTWSAVDVVIERGRRDGAPVALVTPCPTVALSEGRPVVTTTTEVERRGWATVEIVDRTGDDPRTGLFSERLVGAARAELARPGGRVVCILHRTGRVRLLTCGSCGSVVCCTRCGGPCGQAESGGPLECRRCGASRPPLCAQCDSGRLRNLRIGVSRATEEMAALLGTPAIEVTATQGYGAGEDAPLVVGTEAALHRVDHAGLVAFLDFDQHLLAPRFGAGEESLAVLARASRLVGARPGGGRVLVQTRIPDHEVLRAARDADPGALVDSERSLRLQLGLPPFGALAALSGPGAEEYVRGLEQLADRGHVEISSLGEERFLVRADTSEELSDALAAVERPADRLRVEVDTHDA